MATVFIGGAGFCNIIKHSSKTTSIWPLSGLWKSLTILCQCVECPELISVEKLHNQEAFHLKPFVRTTSKYVTMYDDVLLERKILKSECDRTVFSDQQTPTLDEQLVS